MGFAALRKRTAVKAPSTVDVHDPSGPGILFIPPCFPEHSERLAFSVRTLVSTKGFNKRGEKRTIPENIKRKKATFQSTDSRREPR